MLSRQLYLPRNSIARLVAAVALLTLTAVTTFAVPAAPGVPAQSGATLASTIFTFDGKDFTRARTTLVTEAGTSAANTKLDHATAAYKALVQKHAWTGDVTVFGKRYDASYAPIVDGSGKLTGALFVAVPK